ncbi:Acid phosphatase [Paramagnetospirillum magnetotacticum MS-1]|uniref:Acid phosphatase n=1 Tax=Paramagnetospirillum magnetotacticum MS-1 TaxID=272627 RepID=A0A0C2YSF2_PARME|nr:Acid phosphatase [Paramagnetospirillum magnetotacticum MS-1]
MLLLVFAILAAVPAQAASGGVEKINHIVVIYLENRSFDNMFGRFPGADGLEAAKGAPVQVDREGKPYTVLPPILDEKTKQPDPRFPAQIANAPFDIGPHVGQSEKHRDLVHRFYQNMEQINGGRNDKFAAWSDAGGLVMGTYDTSNTRLWALAREFTLADNFFQAAFGGSFLNHFWLICACTPQYEAAPASIRAQLDGDGHLVKDGAVTPDGYPVNTIFSFYPPYPPSATDLAKRLPPQTAPNIGDRLSGKNVSWAWYSGGYAAALEGRNQGNFQYHHQPFVYFASTGEGTKAKARHLKDEAPLFESVAAGRLESVVFYKPVGDENQHPGYADLASGDAKAARLVDAIRASALWKDTAIIITYDENGGFWDHVAPPKGDRWGPGTRIPALIISPYAKRGFVDHTVYDTTSILKLIETRFGLPPLGRRDAVANDLTAAFDFTSERR